MRRKPYPRLTYYNAEEAALVYLRMKQHERLIWRTTDFTDSSSAKGYTQILQALHRLEDNGLLDSRTVGDAGNIWWLKERVVNVTT